MWEVKRIDKIKFTRNYEEEALAYVVKKVCFLNIFSTFPKFSIPSSTKLSLQCESGGVFAISDISSEDLFIRKHLFPSQELKSEHSIVRITLKCMTTAQLFPVSFINYGA